MTTPPPEDALASPTNERRRRRAEELVQQALDLSPAARTEFIAAQCGEDASLLAAVERLMCVPDSALDQFLEQPAVLNETVMTGRSPSAVATDVLPLRVGKYAVVRKIGEGGMGVVYEARQENPRRHVAVKVIRPDLTVPSLLKRFQHEADVLGHLQHPGIAHIYEAGVAEVVYPNGQIARPPFFAMELIHGAPLLEYANRAALDTRQRLDLMARVCDAVQHAHAKGVVHRDLKPGNILVVDEAADATQGDAPTEMQTRRARGPSQRGRETGLSAQPKILDFGVARLTDSDVQAATLHTDLGQLIGTVPYMSPEQVVGDSRQIDTRSDVYALGVILFELLAGRLPHAVRGRSIPEAVRAIREDDPTRLSSINPLFRGDVDTIVAKSLEKDRERRYQTAAELAADVRRYLRDEPIVARPASALYQLRKFARRNPAIVFWLTTTVVVSALGALVAGGYAMRERAQRARADQKTLEAERLAYRAAIAAAQASLELRLVGVARRSLADAPPALRGWEWRHLNWVADRSLRTIDAEGAPIRTVGISDDGRRIASCDTNGRVCLWDAIEGTLLHSWSAESARFSHCILSPDGRHVAAATGATGVVMYDADSGEILWTAENDRLYTRGVFSRDGARIVTTTHGPERILFRDVGTGRRLGDLPFEAPSSNGAAFGGNDSIIAVIDGGDALMYDVATGRLLRRLLGWSWHFRPDARTVFILQDTSLREVDVDSGAFVRSIELPKTVRNWYPCGGGGLVAAYDSAGTLLLFDGYAGRLLATLPAHSLIQDLPLADDGRTLVSGGNDGLIKLWDLHTTDAPLVNRPAWHDESLSWAFSRNGRFVATTGWGTLTLLDTPVARLCWRRTIGRGELYASAISPDDRWIAAGGRNGALYVVDLQSGDLRAAAQHAEHGAIRSLAFSADGRLLLAGTDEGALLAIDPASPNLKIQRVVRAHGGTVKSIIVSPDAALAITITQGVSESADDKPAAIRAWTLPDFSPRPALLDSTSDAACAAFDNSGSLLAVGYSDRRIIVRNVPSDRATLTLTGAEAPLESLAFNPDATRLAAGCTNGNVYLWNTQTGDATAALNSPTGEGTKLMFVGDGSTLAASGRFARLALFETGRSPAAREQHLAARARLLVDPLLESFYFSNDLAEHLRARVDLPDELRRSAIDYVEARGDHANWFNSDAWGVVKLAGFSDEEYRKALAQARRADEILPDDWSILNTLGVGLFRTGDFDAAEAMLLRSDALHEALGRGRHPSNWAYIALARKALGRTDEAQRAIEQARRLMQIEAYASDTDNRRAVVEAESAIKP